jgi:hypothetical protein
MNGHRFLHHWGQQLADMNGHREQTQTSAYTAHVPSVSIGFDLYPLHI